MVVLYYKSAFARLDVLSRSVGSVVSMGNKIGESGKSGYKVNPDQTVDLNPYLPHLHYETLVASSTSGPWTRVQPLTYYPGKRCACGISYNSTNLDITNSAFIRSIGFYVNEEYFIDIDAILDMTTEELERYGITVNKINKFHDLLKSDEEVYKNYNEKIGSLVSSYK